MSDDDRTTPIHLTDEELLKLTQLYVLVSVQDKAIAALPPVYPEGTIAWVGLRNYNRRYLLRRVALGWTQDDSDRADFADGRVTSVEVIPVVPEGHITIPRSAVDWRPAATP